jgi:hypothetical protein
MKFVISNHQRQGLSAQAVPYVRPCPEFDEELPEDMIMAFVKILLEIPLGRMG